MTQRILFVCLGNICRSPTAEGVFRALAAENGLQVEVDSAGTSDWHVGDPPYGPMQVAAKGRGYDLSSLRARQASVRDFTDFDLICVMDEKNRATMEALRPTGSETPVQLFLGYAEGPGPREVPDPYYTRDFETPITLIEAASRGLIAQLLRQ